MASFLGRTVILGEASESDSEEISLNEEKDNNYKRHISSQSLRLNESRHKLANDEENGDQFSSSKAGIGSLLASFGPATSLSKLVNYSAQNLINSTLSQSSATDRIDSHATTQNNQISPIHRTLLLKNQQFHACLNHLRKHPLEKGSKDMQSISQRLVGIQKIIQDANSDVTKLKRELNSLNVEIKMIP